MKARARKRLTAVRRKFNKLTKNNSNKPFTEWRANRTRAHQETKRRLAGNWVPWT